MPALITIPVFADDVIRDAALAAARTAVLSNSNLTPAEKSTALAQIDNDEITQAQAEATRIIIVAQSLRDANIDPGTATTEAVLEAILTAAALAAIKAEIQTDPTARGYAGKTSQQQADLLNTPPLVGGDPRSLLAQICFPSGVPANTSTLAAVLGDATTGADTKAYIQRNASRFFAIHGAAGGGAAGNAAVLAALLAPISAGTPGDSRISVIWRSASGAPFPFMPNGATAAIVTAALA